MEKWSVSALLRKWDLSDIEVTGRFHADTVRRIYQIRSKGEQYILKGIPASVPESEISSNTAAHQFLGNEQGIAPKVILAADDSCYVKSDGYWFYLLEYIEGRMMRETEEDEFRLGKLAKKLHSYQEYVIPSPMSQNTERFYRWFQERSFKKEFDSILHSLPDFSHYDQCLIHSDLGPHNAMIRDTGEAVFIDLDKTGIGSRFLDLGWAFIMQFVELHRESGEMEYHFGLAKAFLEGYYGVEGISREEYELIWKGAVYMHIAYMNCYGPDAVEDLWRILLFGMQQKETLYKRYLLDQKPAVDGCKKK